jgi:hypothetical protein
VKLITRIISVLLFSCLIACVSGSRRAVYPRSTTALNKTIYIDSEFEIGKRNYIIEAIKNWNCSTNNIVNYKIQTDFKIEYAQFIDPEKSIIVVKTTDKNPIIKDVEDQIREESQDDGSTLSIVGLFHEKEGYPKIIYMVDNNLSYYEYGVVFLHEEGHLNGLDHPDTTDSIMYFRMDKASDTLTQHDLEQFCEIYKCDASKMKVCK